MSLVAILVAISAGVVSPSEPGFGGRVEEIGNVHQGKHTGLIDSHDNTIITELDPVLYNPSMNPFIHAGSYLPTNVHRRLPTFGLATNWADLRATCSDSACNTANGGCTITLSDDFVMGSYDAEISFSGKTITIWGQGKVLDASRRGRFFSGDESGSFLELHDILLQNGYASNVGWQVLVATVVKAF